MKLNSSPIPHKVQRCTLVQNKANNSSKIIPKDNQRQGYDAEHGPEGAVGTNKIMETDIHRGLVDNHGWSRARLQDIRPLKQLETYYPQCLKHNKTLIDKVYDRIYETSENDDTVKWLEVHSSISPLYLQRNSNFPFQPRHGLSICNITTT